MNRILSLSCWFSFSSWFLFESVNSLSTRSSATSSTGIKGSHNENINARTYAFSIPLVNARPRPESFVATIVELWNDPRPVSSLIATEDRSYVGQRENEKGAKEEIPYCIISDEFAIENESFQILLYPRGRFVGGASSSADDKDGSSVTGFASAYLRYLPKEYGDEIDVAWKLQLRVQDSENEAEKRTLSVGTSGGLPRSKDTWSSAMTFCNEVEAVESVGRATDWGASTWDANEVCDALDNLVAEGEMTVFDTRKGESSFCWPPFSRGGVGAVNRARSARSSQSKQRDFRVGEVIVPTEIEQFVHDNDKLKEKFIYPGVDYRIMTMTDKNGTPIFSTQSLENEDERSKARLALRPCGWKLQRQLWAKNGMKTNWPVEVDAGLLSNVSLTRFNPGSAMPRVIAAFQRDWVAYTFALVIALTPIPLTLIARNFVSLYAIPSASMEPTLLKGDVLLVEKLPGVYQRTKRGDVILFKPPKTLRDIVTNNGSKLSSTSLFVKRIVGLPGDENIQLVEENNVNIDGVQAVGPDRNMCVDEPLRLIDRLLEKGYGRQIDLLGPDDVYVLGDCKAVSVDSRVFGVLPKENIVGKPLARIWPLDRMKISGTF